MILTLLFSFISLIFIGLVVFGGGQIFIPLFKSFWEMLSNNFGVKISAEEIETVITVSNSTPGVVSTKLGFLTGWLIAQGEWYAWILVFATYLVFVLPSIFLLVLATKFMQKTANSIILKRIIKYTKPAIAGIMIALGIQLFISVIIPQISFNDSNGYIVLTESDKNTFFTNWRFIALLIWAPINIICSFILYKKNFSLFYLFAGSIIFTLIIFQPWI
ncbi:chromate transporter [Mycoplasma iguanae]|uniref:Chromate transporter n=1 Tax=Mycoplasma iguanae TaxID=292461 RepID=A0ABY5R837_9MOLU|nr:chromate transporter [Mycoplasma iguanae]UVD81668.1 chromate transporter [Mycoplasma iguanae]